MEILKDEALVLKKKNVNDNNISLILYSRKKGKFNAIVYRARSSNKNEKMSLSPFTYIDIEAHIKNDDIVIKTYTMNKNFSKIYSNLDKIEISYYIVYVLNKVLEYNHSEILLYDKIKEILVFLNGIDEIISKEYKYKFAIRFLKRIMIEMGIYADIEVKNLSYNKILEKYEEYINSYFDIDISHKKIFMEV